MADDFNFGDIWKTIAPAAAVIGGTYLTTNANTQAANTAQAAAERAAQVQLQGAQIQADAIREGNAQAQQTLQGIRQQAQPGTNYLRNVVAQSTDLTPDQVTQLEALRRSVGNQIHSSNFAGSGRAATALFRKSEGDYRNEALDTNRQRAMTAAGELNSGATSAATGIANSQANTGTNVGKAEGDAYGRAGQYGLQGSLYQAQGGLASGQVMGKAIGDIGSAIATQQRESRYADRLSKIEKALSLGN